jgi:hypothetical protein
MQYHNSCNFINTLLGKSVTSGFTVVGLCFIFLFMWQMTEWTPSQRLGLSGID